MSDILERIEHCILEMQDQIAELAKGLRTERAIVMALMAQHGDPTHLSEKRAAELRGCSARTIKREIERGVYTLEENPATGKKGIPITQFYANWTPVEAIKTAMEREQHASGGTLKSRHATR